MDGTQYISVILPIKLEWEPYYSVPERMTQSMNYRIAEGDRVRVDFAGSEYLGVVSKTNVIPETGHERIKPIKSVETSMPRILNEEISLWRNVSDYYMCTVGEVYKAAYPAGKTNGEESAAAAKAKAEERILRKIEKQAAALEKRRQQLQSRLQKREDMLLKAHKESTAQKYAMEIEALRNSIADVESAIDRLMETSLPPVSGIEKNSGQHNAAKSAMDFPKDSIILSEAQNKAYESIKEGFAQNKPVMLKGLTGSGKTEIYTKLAFEAMEQGHNVLYLVPEIAVSRQLEDRLRTHFGRRLLIFHSGETAAAKRNTAETIRTMTSDSPEAARESHSAENTPARQATDSYIVLGTRSALFLPHRRLGLIIVDEEHDSSYKQDSPAPRYNGRDTALMLSLVQSTPGHTCNILLGSATPSLEEVYNCFTGKHRLVTLSERYHGSGDAAIEIIDTNAERKKRGMAGNFSIKLINHINATLADGGQVIILRSRRAWAPALQCTNCGDILKCPHCNVSLSYHVAAGSPYTPGSDTAYAQNKGEMVCHYCGYKSSYTGKCIKCQGQLRSLGAGTQKIEEEAAGLFPEARIARLDSDTKQSKSHETKIIRDFSKGKIDILIGTQIITKGFDFSNLKLVAVIAADSLLGIQDFRADEKAMQILEQFRGRCGRRSEKGLFVIQTSQPEHPVYKRIASGETGTFSMEFLQERHDFNFPPFTRIIEISVKDKDEARTEKAAQALAEMLRNHFAAQSGNTETAAPEIIGPYAPSVSKISDFHIRTIRISLRKDKRLAAEKEAIKSIVNKAARKNGSGTKIIINADPS